MANESSTAAAQRRRVTKPLMERRRRARINRCLAQLQAFLGSTIAQQAQKQERQRGFQRQTRLEKADILEMTVRYIQEAHQKQSPTSPSTLMDFDDHSSGSDTFNNECSTVNLSNHLNVDDKTQRQNSLRFQEGYKLCMLEVAKFVGTLENSEENPTQKTNENHPGLDLSIDVGSEIQGDRNPYTSNKNKEPSVNVPFNKRRDNEDYKNHLSVVSTGGGRATDLLKHLRNRYRNVEALSCPDEDGKHQTLPVVAEKQHDEPVVPSRNIGSITSGEPRFEVRGQASDRVRILNGVETLNSNNSWTEKLSSDIVTAGHRSCVPSQREVVKEVICQNNNYWWRPW